MLRSGGNPQLTKGNGDAQIQGCVATVPGWKRDMGRHLYEFIVRTASNDSEAVRWDSPFYDIEGSG